jgi:hypothetical protein
MKTYAALTWLQRASIDQPKNDLSTERILYNASNIFPKKAITPERQVKALEKATEEVSEWNLGTLVSIPGTTEQIVRKEANKYLV